jgi:hypothetical protein
MNCNTCGKNLTEYEMMLSDVNDCERGWCLKCIKKGQIEEEELLTASRGL